MPDKYDVYNHQGQKIGEAKAKDTGLEAFAGCILYLSIFFIFLAPMYAVYKVTRYEWDNTGWLAKTGAVFSALVYLFFLTLAFNGYTGNVARDIVIMTVFFTMPAFIGWFYKNKDIAEKEKEKREREALSEKANSNTTYVYRDGKVQILHLGSEDE
jgi:predicted permease